MKLSFILKRGIYYMVSLCPAQPSWSVDKFSAFRFDTMEAARACARTIGTNVSVEELLA